MRIEGEVVSGDEIMNGGDEGHVRDERRIKCEGYKRTKGAGPFVVSGILNSRGIGRAMRW